MAKSGGFSSAVCVPGSVSFGICKGGEIFPLRNFPWRNNPRTKLSPSPPPVPLFQPPPPCMACANGKFVAPPPCPTPLQIAHLSASKRKVNESQAMLPWPPAQRQARQECAPTTTITRSLEAHTHKTQKISPNRNTNKWLLPWNALESEDGPMVLFNGCIPPPGQYLQRALYGLCWRHKQYTTPANQPTPDTTHHSANWGSSKSHTPKGFPRWEGQYITALS